MPDNKKQVRRLPEEKELTSDAVQILREILRWSRFENFPKLRKLLLDTLETDVEKLVYEFTDGERSRYDVAKEIGIPDSTVRNWWEGWYNIGILEPSGKRKGRPQKIVALEDMGIEVPKIPPKKPEVKKEELATGSKATNETVAQKPGEEHA
jgi:predicted ArsR family transcriptional regulator